MLVPPREIAIAAVTGVLTLVDPARLSGRRRTAYRAAVAGLTGVSAQAVDASTLGPRGRLLVGVGAAGATWSTMGLWERMDAGVHGWLRRRGVRHPRLLLTVVGTVGSLAIAVADERTRQAAEAAARAEAEAGTEADTQPRGQAETNPDS